MPSLHEIIRPRRARVVRRLRRAGEDRQAQYRRRDQEHTEAAEAYRSMQILRTPDEADPLSTQRAMDTLLRQGLPGMRGLFPGAAVRRDLHLLDVSTLLRECSRWPTLRTLRTKTNGGAGQLTIDMIGIDAN